ncbi:hypothetical protein GCM10028796_05290 [Ramlibacter monticola]|uniref:Uncharacterized protein n=1 Tax=Ramlibacter monticola TaxID=1926872 RepID=A0A936YXI6_9BURK|nr:hypothetical protein [Ramlibacter monticola]MBL0391194.1 hypothetical protein [Ramlibacter monticola]
MCEFRQRVTFVDMTADPFACPECGYLYLDPTAASQDSALLNARTEEIHRALQVEERPRDYGLFGGRLSHSSSGVVVLPEEMATAARVASRCAAFPNEGSKAGFPRFRALCFGVPSEGSDPYGEARKRARENVTKEVIGWVRRQFPSHAQAAARVLPLIGREPGGLRLNVRMPMLTAAICTMLVNYRLQAPFYHLVVEESGREWTRLVPFDPISHSEEPLTAGAAGCVMLLEMLGCLAFCIARLARLKYTREVAWPLSSAECTYFVAACGRMGHDRSLLRVRTRADEVSVIRLAWRYANRWLDGDSGAVTVGNLLLPPYVGHINIKQIQRLGRCVV